MKKRITFGDRVTTPFGPGVVTGFYEQTTFQFGKPNRQMWLVVAVDDPKGRCRWVTPDQAEKIE